MMSNSKILTVSYGTFSCTLEGFDDSFGTMKAIAEYFRDLASDDRYFGAEPPQPDAEMLTRIAQKEVSRRVQAREQDGQIVLSALEEDAAPQATQAMAQPAEKAPAGENLATAAIAVAATVATDAIEPDTADDQDAIEEDIEIVTSSTQIDDVEPTTAFVEANEDVSPEIEAASDAVIETAPTVEDFDTETPEVAFVEDENDIVPGQPDAEVEAFFAESPSGSDVQEDEVSAQEASEPAVENNVQDAPAPDSIAAKLQRIRAVVAQHEEADDEDDYLEDEHAETDAAAHSIGAEELIADARADIEDALEADEIVDEPSQDAEKDAVSTILNRLDAEANADPIAEHEEEPEQANERSVEDTISNLFDENEETLKEFEQEVEATETSQTETTKVTPSEELVAEVAETTSPRARVIKVKRADLEAAIEKGDLEEYCDDDHAEADAETAAKPRDLDALAPANSKETALSPEDEAELARELAELEDDIATSDTDASDQQDEERHSAGGLPAMDETNDSDVNRLLAESDHQMDEPESATRRDAFAHLRAAVAAKKADVAAGVSADEETSDDAYRDDLAQVVRPRRPVSTSGRSERPKDTRPAPLKLVAEQRIDVAKPATEGPVRPRRIAAQSEPAAEAPEGESFVDFASEMGASTLPQLLEAAAAYMSFVEGREQFSRPQLMSKVRQAGGEGGFTREESLRSFGQLLRTGKIEKIKAGRFTVSEDIGFRPDQRAAG